MDALSVLPTILRASCWIQARWSGPANDSVGTEGSSLLEAALRGNPRHELTAVRALPSEIGRGDDLRSTLVSRRRPVPAVDGGVGILRRLTVAGRR